MAPQSFRLLDPTRLSKWNWLAIFLAVCFLPITATAQRQASIMVAGGAQHRTLQPQGCPNQGGIVTSISVPVGQPGSQPLSLAIIIPFPAPPGGYYFNVYTEDSSIAFAGDPTQGLLPVVFIPEGQEESNTFLLYGFMVGPTFLDATNPDFLPLHVPTAVWERQSGWGPQFFKVLGCQLFGKHHLP